MKTKKIINDNMMRLFNGYGGGMPSSPREKTRFIRHSPPAPVEYCCKINNTSSLLTVNVNSQTDNMIQFCNEKNIPHQQKRTSPFMKTKKIINAHIKNKFKGGVPKSPHAPSLFRGAKIPHQQKRTTLLTKTPKIIISHFKKFNVRARETPHEPSLFRGEGGVSRARTLNTLLMLTLIFAISTLNACSRANDWIQFRGEGGRGVSNSRITPPLGIRWKISLQPGSKKIRSLNPPIVMGDTIYFGSDDGNFYALDVESGYMRWVFKSGAEINSIPCSDKDNIYFGSKDGKLYALSCKTGEVTWAFQAESQINSQVQRYGDYVIFVGDADAVYFLSPQGEEQFRIRNPGWYNYSFLVDNGIMYMGTGPLVELVGPFDIKKREFLWFMDYHDMDAIWYSFEAVKGDLMYMGTATVHQDSTYLGYHAYNRHTGELAWRQYQNGKLFYRDYNDLWGYFVRNLDILDFMSPAVWKDLVIFTGGDNTARALDAKTGELRWEKVFNSAVSSAPTIASGRVYFGLMGDDYNPPKLVCISARDGRLLWQMETEGSILSAPVIAGKRVIFGTDKSVFYVLERVF